MHCVSELHFQQGTPPAKRTTFDRLHLCSLVELQISYKRHNSVADLQFQVARDVNRALSKPNPAHPRNLKGGIGSLFDLCVNAMEQRPN